MIRNMDMFTKTPIIWRARGVDYNINHIISVKPWWNIVTKVNGLKVRLVNGDTDTICFREDYDDPDNDCYWDKHKDDINGDVKKVWHSWCDLVSMSKEDW